MKYLFIFFILISLSPPVQGKPIQYCKYNTIWKHAAYKGKENIKKNISTAIAANYCGLELDINFDARNDIVYIAYDPIESIKEKKYRSLANIDTLLIGYKGYIWLDWKNTEITKIKKGLALIENSLSNYLKDENVIIFIETPNIFHNELLQIFKGKQFQILNWISLNGRGGWVFNYLRWLRAKIYRCFLTNRLISTPDIEISNLCSTSVASKYLSLFLFTVDDIEKAKKAFTLGFSVVLTNKILPSDL